MLIAFNSFAKFITCPQLVSQVNSIFVGETLLALIYTSFLHMPAFTHILDKNYHPPPYLEYIKDVR